MTDDVESGTKDESEGPAAEEWRTGRSTAPQSPYGTREVAIGFGILLVGLAIAIGLPVVATLG